LRKCLSGPGVLRNGGGKVGPGGGVCGAEAGGVQVGDARRRGEDGHIGLDPGGVPGLDGVKPNGVQRADGVGHLVSEAVADHGVRPRRPAAHRDALDVDTLPPCVSMC